MKPYGCHNSVRKESYWVKDGVSPDDTYRVGFCNGVQHMKLIQDRSSKECRYDLKAKDEKCVGCGK